VCLEGRGSGASAPAVAAKPRPRRTVRQVVDVLIVTGPVGAGKTSVAFECLEVLDEQGIAAAMVDAELVYFHPAPADDQQKERVAEAALAALWPLYAAQGIERLLLARVIEKPSHLELVRSAVPDARIQVAWLDVPAERIAERLGAREIGSALDWHLARSEEIRRNAAQHDLFDFAVNGDRPVREVALDVLDGAKWIASVLPDR